MTKDPVKKQYLAMGARNGFAVAVILTAALVLASMFSGAGPVPIQIIEGIMMLSIGVFLLSYRHYRKTGTY